MLDGVRGGVQVNDPLMDAHLEAVPGVGAFTAGGLAGGDLQGLGGETDGASHFEVLVVVQGTLLEELAHLLQVLHVQGGERDPDAVDLVWGGEGG